MHGVGVASDDANGAGSQRNGTSDTAMNTAERIAKLTTGQLDCLRLVDQHLNSKEIAAELQISPHTVDQRIRQALAILGVERRAQAARIVAQHAGPYESEYQRLIYQSPHIEQEMATSHPEAAVSLQIRHADRAGESGDADFQTEQKPAFFRSPLQLPFATRSKPQNEMSASQRLLWIVVMAILAAFSAGMYLAGLESLARLLRH